MKRAGFLAMSTVLALGLASAAAADDLDVPEDRGDRIEDRLDRRGDRIDHRLDRRGTESTKDSTRRAIASTGGSTARVTASTDGWIAKAIASTAGASGPSAGTTVITRAGSAEGGGDVGEHSPPGGVNVHQRPRFSAASAPLQEPKALWMRTTACSTFSRELKAEIRT